MKYIIHKIYKYGKDIKNLVHGTSVVPTHQASTGFWRKRKWHYPKLFCFRKIRPRPPRVRNTTERNIDSNSELELVRFSSRLNLLKQVSMVCISYYSCEFKFHSLHWWLRAPNSVYLTWNTNNPGRLLIWSCHAMSAAFTCGVDPRVKPGDRKGIQANYSRNHRGL